MTSNVTVICSLRLICDKERGQGGAEGVVVPPKFCTTIIEKFSRMRKANYLFEYTILVP